MAIKTRISLKYDTLANWSTSSLILNKGEVAIAILADTINAAETGHQAEGVNQHPVLFKVGDGSHTFAQLPFASALAADVYTWAKKSENDFVNTFLALEMTDGTTMQSKLDAVFATDSELSTAIGGLRTEFTTTLASYYTKSEVDDLFAELREDIALPEGGFTSKTEFDALKGKVEDEDGALAKANDAYALAETKSTVTASTTNGNIKIDGVETVVYTHPAKHSIDDVTGLQDALDGKQAAGDYAAEVHTHVKADITDFAHTHTKSEITDFAHTHTASEITDFADEVAKVKVAEATKATQDGNGRVIVDTYAEKATTLAGYGISDAYTKTETDNAVKGAKDYADQKILDFENAYIKADENGTIDKLNEIAAWIADDEAGATKIISDVAANTTNIGIVSGDLDKVELKLNGIADGDGTVKAAIETAAGTAKSEAIADAAAKYETKGTAQGIVDGLKLGETYEPIGAETRAKDYTDTEISDFKTETVDPIAARVKAIEDAPYATSGEVAAKLNANGWVDNGAKNGWTFNKEDGISTSINADSIIFAYKDDGGYPMSTTFAKDGITTYVSEAAEAYRESKIKYPVAEGGTTETIATIETVEKRLGGWTFGNSGASAPGDGDNTISLDYQGITFSRESDGDITSITHESIKGIKYEDIAVKDDITTAIEALDSSVAATAEADGKVSVLTGVTQADGKLTAKTEVTLGKLAKKDVVTADDFADEVFVFDCGSATEVV